MPKEEKRFENKIKKYIEELGGYQVKQFGCAYTKAGTPDLLCCINGYFVAIEVKAQNGKPSPLQLKNLRDIDDANGLAILAYPDKWQELKALLEALADNDWHKAVDIYCDHFNHLKFLWVKSHFY